MADKRISELTASPALTGSEIFPLVQGATTYKGEIKNLAKFGYQLVITDTTGARTLSATDRGAWVRFTSVTAITLTIPTNAVVAFAIGETFNMIQAAAGQVSIVGSSGVVINKPSSYSAKSRAQGSSIGLVKVGTDEWDLIGDLELTV